MTRHTEFAVSGEGFAMLVLEVNRRGGLFLPKERRDSRLVALPATAVAATRPGEWWVTTADYASRVRSTEQMDGTWAIELYGSPAMHLVVFAPSDRDSSAGWIDYETGFFDSDGAWKQLSPEFLRWAASLARWVRSHIDRSALVDGHLRQVTFAHTD